MYYSGQAEQIEMDNQAGNSLKNKLVAMSNQLAKSQIRWTLISKKLFVMTLTKLKWNGCINDEEIEIDKAEIMNALGNTQREKNASTYLRSEFKKMMTDSYIQWTKTKDGEEYEDGFLFTNVRSNKYSIFVTINKKYKKELENLVSKYTYFLADDVYDFKSGYSYDLFKILNTLYDKRVFKNTRDFTTKQLKEVFGLSINDYVRKDGTFDRYNFEKYCIVKAVDEINDGHMVQILDWGKRKRGNQVVGYYFTYVVKTQLKKSITAIEEAYTEEEYEADELPDNNFEADKKVSKLLEPKYQQFELKF